MKALNEPFDWMLPLVGENAELHTALGNPSLMANIIVKAKPEVSSARSI